LRTMAWRTKLKELDSGSDDIKVDYDAEKEEDFQVIGVSTKNTTNHALKFSLDRFPEPPSPDDDSPKVQTRQELPPPPKRVGSLIRPLGATNLPAPRASLPPKPTILPPPAQQQQQQPIKQEVPQQPMSKPKKELSQQPVPETNTEEMSETELLRQQVVRLQLRNQELQEEAHSSRSLRLSQSLYDAIENDEETIEETQEDIIQIVSSRKSPDVDPFDDYFHVIGSNYATSLVTTISEGLTATDIVNMLPIRPRSGNDDDWNGYEYDSHDLYEKQENAYCQMHRIRSLEDKNVLLQCLEYAPLAALPVIQWCESTLSFQNFMGILNAPDNIKFIKSYIGHLKVIGDLKQLSKIYNHQQDIIEECLLRMKHALLVIDPNERLEAVEDAIQFLKGNQEQLKRQCQQEGKFDISCYGDMLVDYHSLLSRQMSIDKYDANIAAQGKEIIYLEHPRYNITNTTLSVSLQYCLFYHPYADETKLSSPKAMAKLFRLSQHRYIYEAMHTRARIGDWKAVHHLYEKAKQANLCYMSAYEYLQIQSTAGVTGFLKKKLNTGSKDSYSILAVNNFLSVALKYNAPLQFMEMLINELEKPEERFELARKRQLWHIAIKCAAHDLKDRDLLQSLRDEIVDKMSAQESSELRHEIDQLLHGKSIKWKKGGKEGSGIFHWFK
jgi:hypothetical protein